LTQTFPRVDVMTLAGTRPEVIKLSEFVKQFNSYRHSYVYTGQHFSSNMRDIFFEELNSLADVNLQCNTSDVETMRYKIKKLLNKMKPSLLIVYGDTNSTLAGSLAAKQTKTTLVHIEAGLRSFDLRMPEEKNRIRTDQLSDYLLCPTSISKKFLAYERITTNVSITGNLIVDVCKKFSSIVRPKNDLPRNFLLLTLHRAENVDDPASLMILRNKLSEISEYKVIFPIHPRTKKNLHAHNIKLPDNVITIGPVGYLEFLNLLKRCMLVLTDSGGVQEEAIILQKPCITLRHTTERWETILMGANTLYPLITNNNENFIQVIKRMLENPILQHPYGDSVTFKTVNKIKHILSES